MSNEVPCKFALSSLAPARTAPLRFVPINSHLPRQNKKQLVEKIIVAKKEKKRWQSQGWSIIKLELGQCKACCGY